MKYLDVHSGLSTWHSVSIFKSFLKPSQLRFCHYSISGMTVSVCTGAAWALWRCVWTELGNWINKGRIVKQRAFYWFYPSCEDIAGHSKMVHGPYFAHVAEIPNSTFKPKALLLLFPPQTQIHAQRNVRVSSWCLEVQVFRLLMWRRPHNVFLTLSCACRVLVVFSDDKNLPSVPPLQLSVPADYPDQSPFWADDGEQYGETSANTLHVTDFCRTAGERVSCLAT